MIQIYWQVLNVVELEIDDLIDNLPFKVNDQGRLVVTEGNLQLLEKNEWVERRLFVFTDCLIWAKFKKKKKFDWQFCGHADFGSCILVNKVMKDMVRGKNEQKRMDPYVFEIVEMGVGKRVYSWKCDSERQHSAWTTAIDKQLSSHLATQQSEHKQLLEANVKAWEAQEQFEAELANLEKFKRQQATSGDIQYDALRKTDSGERSTSPRSFPHFRGVRTNTGSADNSPQSSPRKRGVGDKSIVRKFSGRFSSKKRGTMEPGPSPLNDDIIATESTESQLLAASKLIANEKRYAASTVLDVLLKEYWIPLCQEEALDMEDLPNLFNNLDQISAIHVALLSQIDQNQKKCAKNDGDEAAQALAGVSALCEKILRNRDQADGMLKQYEVYRNRLPEALKYLTETVKTNKKLNAFVEKDKAAFNEKRLRRLLMVPATRLRVYNNL
eukprot:CAMPEP_0168604374 /NCGR_PEP_ID=MMETSP0420-20121227/15260_1 /TAXON_ID=498008 /ORGANISM="Pessonella sp." /LENGTH=440 /DNA_ID=CAMNT_0008643481 /DNA_START=15 /DNA_END=1335 /DNA_ORIENTATION=-